MKKSTIITIAAILIGTAVFYYLKNFTSVFNNKDTYYSRFSKISGLQESGAVLVNGVKVGKVADIEITADKKVLVTYAIKNDLKIPQGSFAEIINGDVSGTKAVKLYMGEQSQFIAVNGDIPTVPDTTLLDMFNAKITPMLKGGKFILRTADSSLNDINYLIRYGGWGNKAQQEVRLFKRDLEGMATTSGDISQQINKLSNSLSSFSKMVENPGKTNADLNKKIASGVNTTRGLSDKNYDSLLNQTVTAVNQLTSSLKKTSQENKLFNDKKPYLDASRQLDTADRSMKELMKDPPGIQLIGGGK